MALSTHINMPNPIQQHLQHLPQQPRRQAGSLLVSVFGDALYPRGGAAWMGSLIQLLSPLQINERQIRTACFRLVQQDWLQTQMVGNRSNYLLSRAGRGRVEDASRQIYASQATNWDKQWRIIMATGDHSSKDREQLRRALYWQGFGELNSQCFIHPSADLKGILKSLQVEGLGHWQPKLLTLVGHPPTGMGLMTPMQVAKTAWDLAQLDQQYAQFLKTYQPMFLWCQKQKSKAFSDEEAFLLRVLLVHDFRRLLLRDPVLPESLLPTNWQGLQARLLFKKLYKICLQASERHLDQELMLAGNAAPSAEPSVLKIRTK
jgi:phenylacetic acid degradation operon negative regulatory protein